MWEDTRIQTILYNNATVTALLSTYTDYNSVTKYAIFNDNVIPKWAQQYDLPKTINYYSISPVDGGLNYGDIQYSISCRANEKYDAQLIQKAVFDVLNRKASNTTGFFICSALPVIEPVDSTDNYNAPVEVRIKTKTIGG